MDYCVAVKISKDRLSFFYKIKGQPFSVLKGGQQDIPLYFFISGNDFTFGDVAWEMFRANAPNSYGNYFEIIKDPGNHFEILGNSKPVKQLLYYAIEQNLSSIINTVLFRNDSIESCRQNFPIRFIFEPDILDHEKFLVENLFLDAGYNNVGTFDFSGALVSILHQKNSVGISCPAVLLRSLRNDVYVDLYSGDASRISRKSFTGIGADPWIEMFARRIYDYVFSGNQFLDVNKNAQILALFPFAAKQLMVNKPHYIDRVQFLDGKTYDFRVSRRQLSEDIQFATDSCFISDIKKFVISCGEDVYDAVFYLIGYEVNTDYFLQKFRNEFHNVASVSQDDLDKAMEYLFDREEINGYLKPTHKMDAPPSPPPPPPLPKLNPVDSGAKPPLPPVTTAEVRAACPQVPPIKSDVSKVASPPLPPAPNPKVRAVTPPLPPPPTPKVKASLPPLPPPPVQQSPQQHQSKTSAVKTDKTMAVDGSQTVKKNKNESSAVKVTTKKKK
jgi:hypothetical protein